MTLTLYSPAKINLFLRIMGRRPDGYHELASMFQAVSLFDIIHFSLAEQDQLTCTDPGIPVDGSNLIQKAITLFRAKTGLTFGVKVHLEKNIPYQSGLGGGSGNAATTLWALNQLCGTPATLKMLSSWSAEIGSDIPFFFSEGTAYCTGRGELVHSLPSLPATDLWLVKPLEGLSTPAVYKQVNLALLPPRDPVGALQQITKGKSDYFNDLEIPAFTVMPSLANLKQRLLEAGFSSVVMTGSGSGFFCFGKGQPPVVPGLISHPVRFCNRSADQWYS